MRRYRRNAATRTALAAALAAIGLVTAGAAVPGAASATATSTPVLTVTGSTPVYRTLSLTRPSVLTFAGGETPQVQVSGNGRVVGVVLRRLGTGTQPQISVFTDNSCLGRACRPNRVDEIPSELAIGNPRAPRADGYTVTLPAGRYNATLVTDGAPVTARLRLSGLSASTTLRPTTPVKAPFYPIAGVTPEQPGHVYSTGGRTYSFAGPSVLVDRSLYRSRIGGLMNPGACLILGQAPPNNLFLPGCPTLHPSDDRFGVTSQQTAAPEQLTSSQRGGLTGLVSVTPKAAPVTLTAGSYVISTTPLISSNRLQLAIRLPLSAS